MGYELMFSLSCESPPPANAEDFKTDVIVFCVWKDNPERSLAVCLGCLHNSRFVSTAEY